MTSAELTDIDVIVTLMTEGQEMRNRGSGRWLGFPRKPYQAHSQQQVAEAVVQGLEAAGRIKVTLLSTSATAELIQ